MAEIRSSQEIAAKWARVTPLRTEDYQRGVQQPRRDWAQNAVAANQTYVQAVTQAAQQGRFSAGVADAGTPKWQRKTLDKGVNRWGPGVQASTGDYQSGFEPFRQVIEQTQLPARKPTGDPGNIERVRVMAVALRNRKTGQRAR